MLNINHKTIASLRLCARQLSYIGWCVCQCLLLFTHPAIAQENLSVDFNNVIQKNFLGINAVYHAFTYMPESLEEGMTPELRKIEMDRVTQSGLHIARTFYRPDWAMGKEAWTEPDWQSPKMQALYAWLADMKERHVKVGLNMGWWFARDVTWNRDQHLPTYPDDLQKYTAWVSESLHQIIELRGFTNVKYIFMFTEPADSRGDIPNGNKPWQYYKKVLRATQKQLLADHRRQLVKFVGPNTSRGPRWIAQSVKELNDVIDIYASHDYNYDNYQDWYDLAIRIRDAVKSSGKPFWIDEYGIQNFKRRRSGEYGNIIAQANAAFLNAGAQSSMIWILNDQYYPYPLKHISNGDAFLDGKHSWGLYPWLPESTSVRPAWYAFNLLSKYMGGAGTEVFKTEGTKDVHISATKHSDGNITYLVVNGAASSKDILINLSDREMATLYRYSYTPETPQFSQGSIVFQEGGLRKIADILQPKEVVVYSTVPPAGESVSGGESARISNLNDNGNVAYQQDVIVPSNESAGKNITDGKRLTFWSSKDLSEMSPVQIIIDLGKKQSLRRIELYPRNDKKKRMAEGFPKDFTIDLSVDRNNWQVVSSQRSYRKPKATLQAFVFPVHSARYIRLRVTKLRKLMGGKGFGIQLGEIKAFAE